MAILNFMPTFKQVEPSNLYGLTMGWVVAQAPVQYTSANDAYGVATVTKNSNYKFVENGIICKLDSRGEVVNYASTAITVDSSALTGARPVQPFLHYTEELSTLVEGNKYFAVECEQAETYLRLVALVPGTEFTTDNFSGTADSSAICAKVVDGIITIQASADNATCFAITDYAATLADGTAAITVRYLG